MGRPPRAPLPCGGRQGSIEMELVLHFLVSIVLMGCALMWARNRYQECARLQQAWTMDGHIFSAVFFILIAFQFLLAAQYNWFVLGEKTFPCTAGDLTTLQAALLLAFVAYWMTTALLTKLLPSPRRAQAPGHTDARAAYVLYAVILCPIAVFIGLNVLEMGLFEFLLIQGARVPKNDTTFFAVNAVPFLFVACILIVAHGQSLRLKIALIAIYSFTAVFTGGRGAILVGFNLALFALALHGRWLSWRTVLVMWALPLALAVQAFTLVIRYAGTAPIAQQDIWFSTVLESESYAIWKSIYAVQWMDFSLPAPLYSLFSALFFVVPRAMLPDKPIPPSSLFTMEVAPQRFENVGGEITISGFGAAFAEMGLVSGAIVFGVVLAALCVWQARLRLADPSSPFAVVLFVTLFAFWRADLFTASRPVWTFVLVMVAFWFIRGIARQFAAVFRGARAARRVPPR